MASEQLFARAVPHQHRTSSAISARRNIFNPMKWMRYVWLALALLVVGCKQDPVKQYTVTLNATCWDCAVTYAAGTDRGLTDTIPGTVTGSDTTRGAAQYQLVLNEGENLYFRACRIRPDTTFGDIELRAAGEIQPLSAIAGPSVSCAVINQPVQ